MDKTVEIKVGRDYAVAILGGFYNLGGLDQIQVSVNVKNMKVVKQGHTLVTDGEGISGFVELRLKKIGGSSAIFKLREHPVPTTAKTHRRRVIPFILKKRDGQETLDTESFFLTW